MPDQQRIAEITARCEAATPGPWKVVEGKSFGVQSESKNIAYCFRTENEQFIAHSREDIPFLLSQLAVKDAEIERLKAEANADYSEIADTMAGLMGEIERLREAQRWIPVTERLPEDDPNMPRYSETHLEFCTVMAMGFYSGSDEPSVCQTNRLICRRTGIEYVDSVAKVLDEWFWGGSFERITHWMPLPLPERRIKQCQLF